MAIVYEHIFPNGKKYVGITSQKPERRWQNGKSYTNNIHLERAIAKYGWDNIQHVIVGEYETIEEAGRVEQQIIRDQRLQNPAFGYNISSGGEHGKHSDSTKAKLRKQRLGMNNPMYGKVGPMSPHYGKPSPMLGKHLSAEAKAKISKANSGTNNGMYGKSLSAEQIELIRNVNSGINNKRSRRVLCVETGVIYASSGEASRMTGCYQSHISECCAGVHETTGGYHWRYADD